MAEDTTYVLPVLVAPVVVAALAVSMSAMGPIHHTAVDTCIKVSDPPTRHAGWFLATFCSNLMLVLISHCRHRFTQPYIPALPLVKSDA